MREEVALKRKLVNYNIKINVMNGVFAVIAGNLVSPYFAKFVERLGGGDYEIAALSSLPAVFSLFTLIPGAVLIDKFRNKKLITGSIIITHKLFYLLLALVPFLPSQYRAWTFVILVGIMNLPGSIGGMGYQSTIGDIFQNGDLSTAMSSRNTFSTAVGIVVTLLSAQIITKLPNTSAQTILLYQILLVITFILAQGEVISFFKFRGIRTIKKEEKTSNITAIVNIIKNVFKERKYRIFTLSSLVFHFGWQMGWPLFSIYTIDNLKADEMWLSLIAVSSSLASIIAYKKWAKFAKHKGNSYTLFIVTIGMSVTPLLYAVSRSLWALVFFNVIVGIFTAGTTQVLFNLLLEVTPNVNRTGYIAMYNTIMTASAIVSPMIGASIKNHTNIFVALIIVSCLRFIGCFGFRISNKLIGKKIVDV